MNSKYYKLSNEILLEYSYEEYSYLTNNVKHFKLYNEYNKANYFFNSDNALSITNNVRDVSVVKTAGTE
jgi:hypothetical protein